MVKKFHLEEFGFEVEIGKVARQADGAVWFKHGGTVVLATATSAKTAEFPGFLPLSIDYREQSSAAGKIPGGYFKREGKSTEQEVLTGRLIDRSLRPLFPENYFDQIQILPTVYSVDKEHTPSVISLTASSLALCISPIPFLGPVGAVEVGRVDGKWIINPTYQESKASDVRLVVAGTHDGICMVEGSADQLDEKELVDVLFNAHESIKKIVAWQKEIQQAVGKPKKEIVDAYGWNEWEQRIDAFLTDDHIANIYIDKKEERNAYLDKMRADFIAHSTQQLGFEVPEKIVTYIFDVVLEKRMNDTIVQLKKRVDGRGYEDIRHITTEVGLLPFTHGSALFTRGETQALVTATLGSGQDEQRLELIMEPESQTNAFMLHYNFPPFSVGEVRPMRGPGRREIGHGHLAASSFKHLLPTKEEFPYTIRLLSDILESNGSSSMATVCGSTMALMQAGVPLKQMASGIAMGLLKSEKYGYAVLSDISGFEDAFGLMDFKVVGTEKGITAIQMDIKHRGGFSRDIFDTALAQARRGRLEIMDKMKEVMSKPNELSDLVPKVFTLHINPDKIGAVIGTGGKVIREIIEKTGTQIDIESDGLVKIFAAPAADIDLAIRWIKTLAGKIEVGTIYDGVVRKVAEFGIFVELVPGLDGLAHVSNIPRDQQRTFANIYKPNDKVRVKVLDHDETSGRVSLRIENPEN